MLVWDTIVVGTGGVGSAALWQLARRGGKVLGLDRFPPGHTQGSSHGQTRIMRQAYFEHPDYTPLLLECYRLWDDLAARVGKQLYYEVGVLEIGPAEGIVVSGVLQTAAEHKLDVEQLAAEEIEYRWPELRVPGQLVGVLEPRAGYLLVEECVKAHLEAAQTCGAEIRTGIEVQGWEAGPPVRVRTSADEFAAHRLLITAGAWADQLLLNLGLDLEVRRKSMFWYPTPGNHYQATTGFPGFLYELPEGVFYGLPQHDARGVKLAEHSGGQRVEDPLTVNREILAEDRERIERFARQCLPNLTLPMQEHSVCMYTMSADEHFLVDRHPDCDCVLFAAGLSGHGFKFAPVLGQALADLALEETTELPIEFLSINRLRT
ncbi:MAG: N-methyl-L-tryptophan oxidase [Pirellulales bacterium]|nr:N-methyl-L-tryptophan oxidase [Pirellulales bacterium]